VLHHLLQLCPPLITIEGISQRLQTVIYHLHTKIRSVCTLVVNSV
jgi:hypothetical protein